MRKLGSLLTRVITEAEAEAEARAEAIYDRKKRTDQSALFDVLEKPDKQPFIQLDRSVITPVNRFACFRQVQAQNKLLNLLGW